MTYGYFNVKSVKQINNNAEKPEIVFKENLASIQGIQETRHLAH